MYTYKLISSSDISNIAIMYMRICVSHDQKPSTEVLHILNKMEPQKTYAISRYFGQYLLGAILDNDREKDSQQRITPFIDFNHSFLEVLKEIEKNDYSDAKVKVLGYYLNEFSYNGEVPDANFLRLTLAVENSAQEELTQKLMSLNEVRRKAVETIVSLGGGNFSLAMFHMIENKHMSDEIAESLHDIGVQVRFLHDKVKKGDFWFIDYLQDIQKIHRKEFNQPMQREIFIDLVMRTLEGYRKV